MVNFPPIISLNNICVRIGTKTLLNEETAHLYPKDRVCLVGRNGCGKSTLLQVIFALRDVDGGNIYLEPGVKINYFTQQHKPYDASIVEDLFQHFPLFEVNIFAQGLDIDLMQKVNTLSGGQIRRIGLALAFLGSPSVVLLDEPTNHLDLPTIQWLESYLNGWGGTAIVISHDRQFLTNISNRTWWIERESLHIHSHGFSHFEDFSEAFYAEEEKKMDKLDTKLAQETHWLRHGVTARRKRNQGRLRQLLQMRQEKTMRAIAAKQSSIDLPPLTQEMSSKLVLEMDNASFSYPEKKIIHDFSLRVLRKERIGIIGGNGSGKTTLIKIMTGNLPPQSGSIQWGVNQSIVYLDQMHSNLNPNETLWEFLCPNGGDQVIAQGHPYHVVAYLKKFLFSSAQAKSPIGVLSGGEKNRLALAKALAQRCSVLVLDEPTNDLDMDTLDLLQEMLSDFDGTLFIVSHDRDFLDRTVTSVIAVEGDGVVEEYVGGYSDYVTKYQTQKKKKIIPTKTSSATVKNNRSNEDTLLSKKKLSYAQQRELSLLPSMIDQLECTIKEIEIKLCDAQLYTNKPQDFFSLTEELEKTKSDLQTAEERWLALSLF
jgi:ATP-binding cassette subfamily F protein uup